MKKVFLALILVFGLSMVTYSCSPENNINDVEQTDPDENTNTGGDQPEDPDPDQGEG